MTSGTRRVIINLNRPRRYLKKEGTLVFNLKEELKKAMELFVGKEYQPALVTGANLDKFGCMDCSNSCAENCAVKCKKNSKR